MTGVGRRTVLGAGSVAAAGAVLGAGTAAAGTVLGPGPAAAPPVTLALANTPATARQEVATSYRTESTRAGGTWYAYLSVANPDGSFTGALAQRPHDVVQAYSVNKVAVAVAVLDKVDRGLLTLDQTVEVTESIISEGEGIFYLDRAYPSQVTLGHVMAAMLTVSDNTSVRLCGLVAPAAEINQILRAKGFRKTQVEPVANPNRFFLGFTSAWETHKLMWELVRGELLSPSSTDYLLTTLRSPAAFTDGIRRVMSSSERLRIATKAGWFADGRNEAGIIFTPAGAPVLTYSMFAVSATGQTNFGATNPLVAARARMGRPFLSAVSGLSGPASLAAAQLTYHPSNGG